MNRLKIAATALALSLLLCTCASYNAVQQAKSAAEAKDYDQAVMLYETALGIDPHNARLKMDLRHAKLAASRSHFEKGTSLRAAALAGATPTEQLRLAQMALTELDLTVRLDPTNQLAAVELGKAQAQIQDLTRPPDKPSSAELRKRAITKAQPPQLNPASTEPISLSFARETPVKDIYRALGNAFGINVLFDQAVKDDRISIELKDVTAQQALERVMQAANHFYKVLDQHTIIIVPDNPQARRDYEDLVIRTFYLSNGDAEQVTNVVRTMIEARNVFPLKALNAITIRDTADKVRIAEKIIQANDKAKAEVVVDVELVQLDVNKLRQLGLKLGSYSVGAQIGAPSTSTTSTDTTGTTATSAVTSYSLDFLRHLGSGNLSFTVPSSATLDFIKNATDSESLANPQLRILEGEKATLHIGKRIPVPVTTFSSVATGGTSTFAPATSFQYQDVGIKVSMEPRVHHNHEVTLKLTIEVSDQAGSVGGTNGQPDQPIIATRTIEDTIRLKDGETNFLAGLIQYTDITQKVTLPFLGDLPVIGRFFNHDQKQHASTDLMLTLTPHIIRTPDITEEDEAPMWVGTTNNLTFRGVSPRIESRAGVDPFTPARTADQFTGNNPAGAIRVTPDGVPSTVVRPEVKGPVPAGGAPTDPFNKPVVVKPPDPEASLNAPPGATPPVVASRTAVSQGTAPSDVFKTAATSATATTASAVPSGTAPTDIFNRASVAETSVSAVVPGAGTGRDASLAPRLSPQPINLALKPGEERVWNLMGMDLDGLVANSIVLHFNANAMDVADVQLGPAIVIDPASPPSVAISRETGTVRIAPTNGRPIAFAGGGLVAALRVHGGPVSGDAFLVIENPALQTTTGDVVAATIGSGHLHIQ